MQQPFRMPPMGQGQQRPTGSLTDVGQRRPPRPTHVWDPERGVIPLDPNAPAKFVPPPPPEVVQAYTQGMTKRQGVAREFPAPMGRELGTSGEFGLIDPATGAPMLIGATPRGMDNEFRPFWPSPENVPIPIPTRGWQQPGQIPGRGSY